MSNTIYGKTVTSQQLYNEIRRQEKNVLPCWNKRKYHRRTALLAIQFTRDEFVSHIKNIKNFNIVEVRKNEDIIYGL